MKFKVGDRVREPFGYYEFGTVLNVDRHDQSLPYLVEFDEGPHLWTPEERLELISQQPTRTEFDGGGMRDVETGKPRFDLLMPERVPYEQQYLTRCARLLARGAHHYEDRNWEKMHSREAYERFRSSAMRHFMQWMNGETDEDHAAAIFFNVQGAEYVKGRLNGDFE